MTIDTSFGSRTLAGWACAALALGLAVYLMDRPTDSASLIPTVAPLAGRHVFGALGAWLPSFVHPFAFGLLTAAALPDRAALRYGACAAWGLVNLLFEAGQHAAVKSALAGTLLELFGPSAPVRWVANYFVRGTFDVGDLAAAVLGAAAAAWLLRRLSHRPEPDHAR